MNEVRDILAKALPDVPPMTSISRDDIISAGRRARTRRTWLTTSAAGVSTLVIGAGIAGGITWGQRPSGTNVHVGAAPSSFAAMSPSPTPPWPAPSPSVPDGLPPPTDTSPDPNAGQGPPASMLNVKPALTTAFRTALTQVAPGVTTKAVKEAFGNEDVQPFEVVKSQGGYKTWAELTDSKGKSTLFAYMEIVSFEEMSGRFASFCTTVNPGMSCSKRSVRAANSSASSRVSLAAARSPSTTSMW